METLTKDHPRWPHFIDLLDEAIKRGTRYDHTFTRMILSGMSNIDVEASLKWMQDHGGCCDVEVSLSVDGPFGDWTGHSHSNEIRR